MILWALVVTGERLHRFENSLLSQIQGFLDKIYIARDLTSILVYKMRKIGFGGEESAKPRIS